MPEKTYMVTKHLVGITVVVLVQQHTTLIAGEQHLSDHGTYKPIKKKTFLGSSLK